MLNQQESKYTILMDPFGKVGDESRWPLPYPPTHGPVLERFCFHVPQEKLFHCLFQTVMGCASHPCPPLVVLVKSFDGINPQPFLVSSSENVEKESSNIAMRVLLQWWPLHWCQRPGWNMWSFPLSFASVFQGCFNFCLWAYHRLKACFLKHQNFRQPVGMVLPKCRSKGGAVDAALAKKFPFPRVLSPGGNQKTRMFILLVVSNIFYFHPYFGEMIQFDEYFSDGLVQPPTSF